MKSAIVIGGGIGGLSAAAYLSKIGVKTHLFEKLGQLGGCVHTFKRGKYSFEASTHQMLGFNNKRYMKAILQSLGIDDILPIRSEYLNEFIRFEDSKIQKRLLLPADGEKIKEEFLKQFPGDRKNIEKIFSLMKGTTEEILAIRRPARSLNVIPCLFDAIAALMLKYGKGFLKSLGKKRYKNIVEYMNKSFDEATSFIENDQLKWALSQYWMYLGCPPERMSSMVTFLLSYLFYNDGPWLLKNGTGSLIDSLERKIIENGGNIHISSGVKKIVTENGSASGVITEDGEQYSADIVISSIDVGHTFFSLVGHDHVPEEYSQTLKDLRYSVSAFQIFLGMNIDIRDYGYKAPTNFFSSHFDSNFSYSSIMKGPSEQTPFLLTGYEPELALAPEGHSTVTILEYVPFDQWENLSKQEYAKKKQETCDFMIDKAERITGIPFKDSSEVVIAATPRTFQRYMSQPGGAILSSELSANQAGMNRLSAETPIENLYLAGSYTGGPGITSCLDSGICTVNEIIRAGK